MSQIYNKNNNINKIKLYEPILIQYKYIDNILKMDTIKQNIQEKIILKIKKKKQNTLYVKTNIRLDINQNYVLTIFF